MVHLQLRSCYSLLMSTVKIEEAVNKAKQLGYKSLALSDVNVMHGAMAFKHACLKAKIQPLFGLETNVLIEQQSYSFVCLAKDDTGYLDLMKLSSELNTHDFKLDLNHLASRTSHCVVIFSFDHTALDSALINEDENTVIEKMLLFNEVFNDFYCAIAMNDSKLLQIKNRKLKTWLISNHIQSVAINRTYMLDEQDEMSYKVLCAIKQQTTIQDKTLDCSKGRYMRSIEEMNQLYDKDDLEATEHIANACQVSFNFKKSALPHFENKFNVTSQEYLKSLCMKGLEKRLGVGKVKTVYKERLLYELSVINEMHFEDYFLIVYDFIRYAKTQKIYVGPGRGSAPGSLVAYCLGITHLDPIKYHLLFERFLNPERISMPDIDTDFPDDRRDEVIEYVKQRYGVDHVAQIVTFQTLAAKAVLRDAGKAIGIAAFDIDLLCKCIPSMLANKQVTLQSAYQDIPRFKQYIHSKKEFTELFEFCLKLEGLPKNISTHAAGVVLSNIPIEQVAPLIQTSELTYSTQFTMEHLEELGLIKMDFLGLRNLTIIDEIVQAIQTQGDPKFDIMKISLEDQKTYECISDADTAGVFQLESEGMRNLIAKMKPSCFEDVGVAIALFRPGPMENIPTYLENRKQPDKIVYLHPDLIPILKETYGVIVYQEQIMQIAQKMAGFSLARADVLRKAMSKKKLKDLESLREEFMKGANQCGYSLELAEQVYELILKFANYGFNKSHSIAYALVAYQMAYLKINYPQYFFTSLLNSVIGSETMTNKYIFEAKKRGLPILAPSINLSSTYYVPSIDGVVYPFLGIKNVGTIAASIIEKERSQKGPYSDFFDFVARMSLHKDKVNSKVIESLIKAGAFDCFKYSRSAYLATLNDAIRYGEIVKVEDQDQVTINFDLVSKPPMRVLSDNSLIKARQEKEVLGFYLSNHPITQIRASLNFKGGAIVENKNKKGYIELLGTLVSIRQHKTRMGDLMAFSVLEDETGQFDCVFMPNQYRLLASELKKGRVCILKGKVDKENSCLVNSVEFIDQEEA